MMCNDDAQKQVLLVEDDFLLAMNAEDELSSTQRQIVVANTVSEAISEIAKSRFDCAILDYNLGDETSVGIARRLEKSGTPYAIVSGANRTELKTRFGNMKNIFQKPADYTLIVEHLLD